MIGGLDLNRTVCLILHCDYFLPSPNLFPVRACPVLVFFDLLYEKIVTIHKTRSQSPGDLISKTHHKVGHSRESSPKRVPFPGMQMHIKKSIRDRVGLVRVGRQHRMTGLR